MLHLKKFTLNEDWTPRKLDVAVEMPDVLSLNQLRGKGQQPNEEPLQDLEGPPPSKFVIQLYSCLLNRVQFQLSNWMRVSSAS